MVRITKTVTLIGVSFLIFGCGNAPQADSVRNADELAVLAQSSFYKMELTPTVDPATKSAIPVPTQSVAVVGETGFIPAPAGSNGGNDGGFIPAPTTIPIVFNPIVSADPSAGTASSPAPVAAAVVASGSSTNSSSVPVVGDSGTIAGPVSTTGADGGAIALPASGTSTSGGTSTAADSTGSTQTTTAGTTPGAQSFPATGIVAQNPLPSTPSTGSAQGGNLPSLSAGTTGSDQGSVPPPSNKSTSPDQGTIAVGSTGSSPSSSTGPTGSGSTSSGPAGSSGSAASGSVAATQGTEVKGSTGPPGSTGGTAAQSPGSGTSGTTQPCTDPTVCPGVKVTLNRVCSVWRSEIPFPDFEFFEEASHPLLTFEANVAASTNGCSSTQSELASLGGGMPHPMESTLLNLALNSSRSSKQATSLASEDLRGVDLLKGKFNTQVSLAFDTIRNWYPRSWRQVWVNVSVCDDSDGNGHCDDEVGPTQLLALTSGFKLGRVPRKLRLFVWSGRNRTLAEDPSLCEQQYSPIVLDLSGNGFVFSGADRNGVLFDLNDTGHELISGWTNSTDDAFLVHDINGNGLIDSGAELFGSATRLADGTRAGNGFTGLAQFDSNGNGLMDPGDKMWPVLRLWLDRNHNGISERGELFSLNSAGIESINVSYYNAQEYDPYGNETRQRSTFRRLAGGVSVARQIIDVWFDTLNTGD